MTNDDVLLIGTEGRVRTLTLNRPQSRNALSAELRRRFFTAPRDAEADNDVDVVIVTGADPVFCAGLDLMELGDSTQLRDISPYTRAERQVLHYSRPGSAGNLRWGHTAISLTTSGPSAGYEMLQALARFAIAGPKKVIVGALLVMAAAGVFAAPAMDSLSAGGMRNSTSPSWYASKILADKFDQGDMQLIVTVSSDDGAQGVSARHVATDLVSQLERFPFVTQVHSAWTAPPPMARSMLSEDGRTGLIVAGITGGESGAQKNGRELLPLLHGRNGVTVTPGGEVMTYIEANDQSKRDLLTMEAFALPISFGVLVWVFGGLLAAAVPLAVGIFAIVGSMAILRAVASFTEVSIFSLNLAVVMGLALAIDYTLLIVSRFRDEIADGAERDEALVRTMATAGRTVLFSALTVSLSMATMALFPMYFLKSLAYAGVAVVALAAAAAVVVTPAAIALLGTRLDALDMRRFGRRLLHRPQPATRDVSETFWYRWTKRVLRRSIPIGATVIALLLMLGAPFLGVKWGFPDDRVLGESATSRQVGDTLRSDFATNSLTTLMVVIPNTIDLRPAEIDRYARQLSKVADVQSVSAPGGTFASGVRVGPPLAPAGLKDGSSFFTVSTDAPLYSAASEAQLDRLHAVATPGNREVMLTGQAQINRDGADAVASTMPLVLALIAVISFVLLFLLTGSVVLPLKALVLNVLSLTASFGALVWVFQDAHLGAFGTTATGTMAAQIPALLFCLAFGLSMDYEVFLVSRIREHWLSSAQTRADNDEAVALGIARTGRVVTAAALLMAVSFSTLMAAEVSVMRMFGLGLTLAVLADATIVRMMLMPAFMHLLGRYNWWAPAPMRRLHERFGITESRRPILPVPVAT
jgi:putative drug exporter of the RND superfamily